MVTPADCLGQEVTPGTPSVPVHPHLCAPFRLPCKGQEWPSWKTWACGGAQLSS